MAVILMVVYIYIYIENFIKQIQSNKSYILNLKNAVANVASQFVIFFQNPIRIKRLMLGFNPTH